MSSIRRSLPGRVELDLESAWKNSGNGIVAAGYGSRRDNECSKRNSLGAAAGWAHATCANTLVSAFYQLLETD